MIQTAQASAPGKLILMGEHAVVYGYPCLITAVNQSIQVTARTGNGEKGVVSAPQVSKTDFVDELVRRFKERYQIIQPVDIETFAELTDQTGLGSSSASTVAVCKALNILFNTEMTKKEMFDISFATVLRVQGSGSGADIAAAVYGGTLYFKNKGEQIEPLDGTGMDIVIGNTGQKAPTKEYIQKVAKLREQKPEYVETIFKNIEDLVEKGRQDIAGKDYEALGRLMDENHALLQKLDVSSEKLDELVHAAKTAGAYGAKLSGAGGGDNMFALVAPEFRAKVEEAIERNGGKVIHAQINYAVR